MKPSPPRDIVGRPARILIVDDEPDNRQLLARILNEDSYLISTASNGEEALAVVAREPPDLILLDVVMPGMGGNAVVARIKEDPATRNIPVIVISGLGRREDMMRALNAGAEDFLIKPVNRAELSVRVHNLLRLKAHGDYHNKYSQLLESEVGSRTDELVESERLYQVTFDAAPVGIVAVGPDGRWLRVNQRLCDLLGYPRAELQGCHPGALLQSEEVAGEAEAVRLMAVGELERHAVEEKQYRRRDGSFLWARVNMSVHRDASGQLQHFIAVLEDITARRALEEEVRQSVARLAASELRYRMVLESAQDVIAMLTPGGEVREVNQRWVEVTGRPREALIGHHIRELAPGGKGEENVRNYDRMVAAKLGRAAPVAIAGPNGSVHFIEFSTTFIDVAGDQVVFAIGREVTEQLKLEQELRRSQKLAVIGRLAAGVAHEINTPVQFISDSLTFIQDALGDLIALIRKYQGLRQAAQSEISMRAVAEEMAHSEREADLEYLLNSVPPALDRSIDGLKRVAAIVRSLKAFAHTDRESMASIDLNQTVATVLMICKHEYSPVADVETDLQALPMVVCNGAAISEVILSLMVNAAQAIEDVVKVSGGRGRIDVRGVRDGDDAVLTITDTGSGIPTEIGERIFEPFFTTKEFGRGTGQSLAVARSIVEQHGGTLSFESTIPGGTTFRVRLPLVQHDRAPPPGDATVAGEATDSASS